uniref:Uncharacterized protein n=1 Tax=Thelohanellus kitauei TaxID=669202 RepID=A0A0C2NA69_THEKT|nr:hypothetical protein RF11_04815 [Thelohanellus kitauei]
MSWHNDIVANITWSVSTVWESRTLRVVTQPTKVYLGNERMFRNCSENSNRQNESHGQPSPVFLTRGKARTLVTCTSWYTSAESPEWSGYRQKGSGQEHAPLECAFQVTLTGGAFASICVPSSIFWSACRPVRISEVHETLKGGL